MLYIWYTSYKSVPIQSVKAHGRFIYLVKETLHTSFSPTSRYFFVQDVTPLIHAPVILVSCISFNLKEQCKRYVLQRTSPQSNVSCIMQHFSLIDLLWWPLVFLWTLCNLKMWKNACITPALLAVYSSSNNQLQPIG